VRCKCKTVILFN